MTVTVNGRSRELDSGITIQALLDSLAMQSDRVAVEWNRSILPRNRFAETILSEGDTVEIVQFVGGG